MAQPTLPATWLLAMGGAMYQFSSLMELLDIGDGDEYTRSVSDCVNPDSLVYKFSTTTTAQAVTYGRGKVTN